MSTNNFSLRLAELMAEEKLSKRALSKSIGVQRKSIMDWLNGKYCPRYSALIKVADHFGVSIEYLLGAEQGYAKSELKLSCAMEDVPKRFIGILNNYMHEHQISKYKLAKDLEIGESTLKRWFDNDSMPEIDVILRLSKILHEPVDYLLGRE